MWQAPNQRARALATARKRERERQRNRLHIKRVKAELKVSGGITAQAAISPARVVLNDLNVKGVGLFSPIPYLVGQEVAVMIEEPKRFYIKGRVVWCMENEKKSHILSQVPYSYRLGVEFIFDSPKEKESVQQYCEEILKEFIMGTRVI